MSVYSVALTGPSAKLAMLRALAVKTMHVIGDQLATARLVLSRAARITRATTTTALAVLGSETGYQLVRRGLRAVLSKALTFAGAGLRLLGRGAAKVGQLALSAMDIVSPATARVIDETWHQWVARPVTAVTTATRAWVTNVATVAWHLSGTALVKGITVRVAQAAGLMLAVHSITKGAAAAKVVQLIPAAMTAAVFLTDPVKVAALVGIAFVTAMVIAALRVLDRPDQPDPEIAITADNGLLDLATPDLLTGPVLTSTPDWDLAGIAAKLQVEVTVDGSVLVHGIPVDLPEEVGLQVAHIAADAATARLQRILLHKASPNRDDRRLITKVAREAVRVHGRQVRQPAA